MHLHPQPSPEAGSLPGKGSWLSKLSSEGEAELPQEMGRELVREDQCGETLDLSWLLSEPNPSTDLGSHL